MSRYNVANRRASPGQEPPGDWPGGGLGWQAEYWQAARQGDYMGTIRNQGSTRGMAYIPAEYAQSWGRGKPEDGNRFALQERAKAEAQEAARLAMAEARAAKLEVARVARMAQAARAAKPSTKRQARTVPAAA